jgi:hypothetical protein
MRVAGRSRLLTFVPNAQRVNGSLVLGRHSRTRRHSPWIEALPVWGDVPQQGGAVYRLICRAPLELGGVGSFSCYS